MARPGLSERCGQFSCPLWLPQLLTGFPGAEVILKSTSPSGKLIVVEILTSPAIKNLLKPVFTKLIFVHRTLF